MFVEYLVDKLFITASTGAPLDVIHPCSRLLPYSPPLPLPSTMLLPRSLLWLPACCALLAWAVAARMHILSALLSWASGVGLTVSDLTLDATTGVPSSFTIIVHELLAYAPDGLVFTNDLTHENLLANISRATVSLGWHDACDASWLACLLDVRGNASIDGVQLHFVSYDALFHDTNVKRLVLALGGDEAAATGALAADSTAAAESSVVLERLRLSNVAIWPSLRQGGIALALPPITLLDESLDLEMLGAGLSVGRPVISHDLAFAGTISRELA